MTTFARWLQAQIGRTDATGWLADEWGNALHRPRVSTPSAIEKHLAQVHSGDETYIGQLASAVRIATDAYHHRDDPPSDADQANADQMLRNEGLARNDVADAGQEAAGTLDMATGQFQLAEGAVRINTDDWSDNQFDDTRVWRMSVTQKLADQSLQQDRIWALLRTIAATLGINVDDDSIEAMRELWDGAPAAAAEITADESSSFAPGEDRSASLAAQLAEPIPPQAFATWWNSADLSAGGTDE